MYKICEIDNKPIITMAFIGTGVCSELCRKERSRRLEEGKKILEVDNPAVFKENASQQNTGETGKIF